MGTLKILPSLDSDEKARALQRMLDIPRDSAAELGRRAQEAARSGFYLTREGRRVEWGAAGTGGDCAENQHSAGS